MSRRRGFARRETRRSPVDDVASLALIERASWPRPGSQRSRSPSVRSLHAPRSSFSSLLTCSSSAGDALHRLRHPHGSCPRAHQIDELRARARACRSRASPNRRTANCCRGGIARSTACCCSSRFGEFVAGQPRRRARRPSVARLPRARAQDGRGREELCDNATDAAIALEPNLELCHTAALPLATAVHAELQVARCTSCSSWARGCRAPAVRVARVRRAARAARRRAFGY